jgi:hypothetical protein
MAFAAVFCAVLSSARAGTLVDFIPAPASPGVPEVIWSQQNQVYHLYEGSGALSLSLEVPFVMPGLPGSVVDGSSSTTFSGASLLIDPNGGSQRGLPSAGPLSVQTVTQGIQIFWQPLDSGEFQIWSAPSVSYPNGVLLLDGTINSSVISGILYSASGSLASSDVSYNSGAILNAAEGLPPLGGTPVAVTGGQLSWSFLDASPQFQPDGGTSLAPFNANATGQFSGTVPEPGIVTMLLSGLPLAFFAGRRWRSGRGCRRPAGAKEVA